MERVAEMIALAVLQNICVAVEPPLSMEELKKNFYARWPTDESRFPINDAMRATLYAAISSKERAHNEWDEDKGTWKTPIADAWDDAAAKAVAQYFDEAQRSFDREEPLEATETLTDAVRAALGYIAATQEWPHGTRGELYNVAEGLAAGTVPKGGDNAIEYPSTMSEEGMDLCSFFAASMGRPDSVKFGFYGDNQNAVREDAILFARRTIERAGRLAKEKAALS